jgi:hypothetical protein
LSEALQTHANLALVGRSHRWVVPPGSSRANEIALFGCRFRSPPPAIQDITVDTFMEGKGSKSREVRRIKFKLRDKRAALVDLGRYLGRFKDISDNNQKVDASTAFVEMLRAISPKHNPKLVDADGT